MNKAYLLVICVLAASFTGCLSDDSSDLEEQQNTEDETIEPVGTDNNETEEYWYNELIAEVENLTDEVKSLKSEINNMMYDPAEFSNISMKITPHNAYDVPNATEWRAINFSKMGNTIHMNASFDIPNEFSVCFYDNAGQMIRCSHIVDLFDRCYTNGNWTTSYSECAGDTSTIIYEFNLLREPMSVHFNQVKLVSFP